VSTCGWRGFSSLPRAERLLRPALKMLRSAIWWNDA
jgi:hypothetical protein